MNARGAPTVRIDAEPATLAPGPAPVDDDRRTPDDAPAASDAPTDEGAARRGPGRFRSALRGDRLIRHLPLAAMVLFSMELRGLATIAYRPGILFRGDSYGYLSASWLLHPGHYRPLLYGFLLWPWTHGHALGLVVPVQHLLGVALGVAIYAILVHLGVRPWLAAVAAALVLLDGYQVDLESFFMAETLFEVLVVAAIALLVWRRRPGVVATAGAGALLAAAGLTRSVGLFLIVPALVFLIAKRVGWWRVAVAVVAFATPLLLYATWYQSQRGAFTIEDRQGYFLYGRVATFADCTKFMPTPVEQVLCDPRPPSERPSANAYIWGRGSPIRLLPPRPAANHDRILQDFAIRAIEGQPWTYLGVIAGDVLHAFEPGHPVNQQDEPVAMWQFPTRLPALRHLGLQIPPTTVPGAPAASFDPGIARILARYQRWVYTPGPVLALGLVLGLLGAVGLPRHARRRLRAESLLLAGAGLIVLLVPAATAMFDYRYVLPTIVLLPPAGALGATVLWGRWRDWSDGFRMLVPERISAAGGGDDVRGDAPGRDADGQGVSGERGGGGGLEVLPSVGGPGGRRAEGGAAVGQRDGQPSGAAAGGVLVDDHDHPALRRTEREHAE
jgi:hypothetical protein